MLFTRLVEPCLECFTTCSLFNGITFRMRATVANVQGQLQLGLRGSLEISLWYSYELHKRVNAYLTYLLVTLLRASVTHVHVRCRSA
jgi:hypothetical protein